MQHTLRLNQTHITTWFERDRAMVELVDTARNETILAWWDEDVFSLIEDGFFNPRDYHLSAYDYAVHLGVING